MWDVLIQGFIQGLTEFLPVRSSGHLVLAQHIFGFQNLDPAFNVFVQGGTVISLVAYYLPRFKSLTLTPKYLGLLIIATVPAVIAGLALEDYMEQLFSGTAGLALGFMLTTIFIALTYRHSPKESSLTPAKSLGIGLAQAAAILPSLSRSGATIGTALMLGIKAEQAFDFSFLMSIPVLVGSTLLIARHLTWSGDKIVSYGVGFAVAALTGYVTLVLLAKVMRQGKFYLFAPYTAVLALVSLFL